MNKKKLYIIVVLLAIVLLSTTTLVLAVSGVFDNISEPHISRDRTSVILTQDENDEKLIHVSLGMADDASVASFQVGLDIDVIDSADIDFRWSDSLKEDILKNSEFSEEANGDKRLNLYYVGTKELNTNDVDVVELGTISANIPDNMESQLVIAPDQNFTTIASIGHNRAEVITESTDILTTSINRKVVAIEKIELNETEKEIDVNDVFNLTVNITPSDTTEDKTIKWSTSDDSVAIVDYNGTVTGLSKGIAYIYAEVGDFKVSCKVTVNQPKVALQKIELNKVDVTLTEGQKENLSVRYIPDGVIYEGTLLWESSEENVATVNNGEIVAISAGETVITVTANEDGNTFTATCNVKVEALPEDTILINENDFELSIGHTEVLSVISNNIDVSNVTWKSSEPDIISIDENGVVKALKEGKATITAIVGDKEATIEITAIFVDITSIKAKVDKKELKVGETTNIDITVLPENASLPLEYEITSSDSEIVSVDENQKLVANKAGKAIITVKAKNGVKDQTEIIVIEEKSEAPSTGDIALSALIVVALVSIAVIAVLLIKKDRLSNN